MNFVNFAGMDIHEMYMKRCLFLAEKGRSFVAPNPMVGAVIVYDNMIIGEGFHTQYGKPHAEVEAVASVADKQLLKESTLYVSLEPCCHYGKTPPCTSLILDCGIPRVVVATRDPNPKVSGKGIEILKAGGVEVIEGICQAEAELLNIRFNTFHLKQRPYIILKWAQSADGFLDLHPRPSSPEIHWISNEHSKQLVHKWRSEESAILIGKNTAINDNAELTTRLWPGKNPIRILIDPELETPFNYNIYNDRAATICFHHEQYTPSEAVSENIQFFALHNHRDMLLQILDKLFSLNITSVIVEGGQQTLQGFIEANIWDEIRKIRGTVIFGNGTPAPLLNLHPERTEQIVDDIIEYYFNKPL